MLDPTLYSAESRQEILSGQLADQHSNLYTQGVELERKISSLSTPVMFKTGSLYAYRWLPWHQELADTIFAAPHKTIAELSMQFRKAPSTLYAVINGPNYRKYQRYLRSRK